MLTAVLATAIPSVRPAVTAGIVSKRMNIGWWRLTGGYRP